MSYGAWYWIRQRTLERAAETHQAAVRDGTEKDFDNARKAMAAKEWVTAGKILTERKTLLQAERNPKLATLTEQTGQMLAEVDSSLKSAAALAAEEKAKTEVQDRFDRFLDQRREALYRDTDFTGLLPATNLELTRKTAEGALSVFAQRNSQDNWKLGDLPAFLSSEQQAEVRDGCYELLMVLADVAAREHPVQVDRGLRVLESAARLRPDHPRVYYLKKASLLAAKNDRAGADRELAAAAVVPPRTAFDYFLVGQDEYKHRRWTNAINDFGSALRDKPGHFWARCLQAICFISTDDFDAANSNLTSCLDAEPNSPWLYLLRGLNLGKQAADHLKHVATSRGRQSSLKDVAESEFDKAEADFQSAQDLLKRSPDNDLSYVLFVNRGLIRYQRDHLDEAAADYLAAIRTKKHPNAHAELAFVYQKQGKTAEAIAEFGEAIALKPDYAPFYRGRADLLLNRQGATPADRQAAQADLKLSIRHEDKDSDVLARDHTNLGKLYYLDDQFEDALEETKRALRLLLRTPMRHYCNFRFYSSCGATTK